jgi:acetoin utilization deacetylase AcuC-like enzyme
MAPGSRLALTAGAIENVQCRHRPGKPKVVCCVLQASAALAMLSADGLTPGWLAVFCDKGMLGHIASLQFVEAPVRVQAVCTELNKLPPEARKMVDPSPVLTDAEIKQCLHLAHNPGYVELIRGVSYMEEPFQRAVVATFQNDVVIDGGTSKAAILAAMGTVQTVRDVLTAGPLPAPPCRGGIAVVRPPGHHATRNGAMGFCFFNNVAVAALDAVRNFDQRVLVVDWDLHHGNGTQDIFSAQPADVQAKLLCVSTHLLQTCTGVVANLQSKQKSFYPGPIGRPELSSTWNANVGWTYGHAVGDREFLMALHTLLPRMVQFQPTLVLVSCGFDSSLAGSEGDLAGTKSTMLNVTAAGYSAAVDLLKTLPVLNKVPHPGRVILVMEGGYRADNQATLMLACAHALLREPMTHGNHWGPFADVQATMAAVRDHMGAYPFLPPDLLHTDPKCSRPKRQGGAGTSQKRKRSGSSMEGRQGNVGQGSVGATGDGMLTTGVDFAFARFEDAAQRLAGGASKAGGGSAATASSSGGRNNGAPVYLSPEATLQYCVDVLLANVTLEELKLLLTRMFNEADHAQVAKVIGLPGHMTLAAFVHGSTDLPALQHALLKFLRWLPRENRPLWLRTLREAGDGSLTYEYKSGQRVPFFVHGNVVNLMGASALVTLPPLPHSH